LTDLALIPLHKSLDPSDRINQLCASVCARFSIAFWANGANTMKARTGSIVKHKPRTKSAKATWWAQVAYIDPKTGKRRDLQRRAACKAPSRDAKSAAAALDAFNAETIEAETAPELVHW